jgi:sugar phosphate isomerase/epimerase
VSQLGWRERGLYRVKFTLNISTHPGDQAIIGNDWKNAQKILATEGFDGYELYPVGDYQWESIPAGVMTGMHLRFYPILKPFWIGDKARLLEIFGDMETVIAFYGGPTRESLVENYRKQLALAQQLGCEYAVFHLSQSEFDYIYHWRFPWNWRETIDMCAELLNAAMADSPFSGELLLENLWWPGSFRALHPEEIEYALSRIAYPRTGIVLDTGHVLNTNQSIFSEAQGIEFLIDSVRSLGELSAVIRGLHLTRSLSADYVTKTQQALVPPPAEGSFWHQYHQAIIHVNQIDQHDPFDDPAIKGLFDVIHPDYVTYEFSYKSEEEWLDKIRRQRRALAGIHLHPKEATCSCP